MTEHHVMDPLDRLSPAERARSVVAASSRLVWVAGSEAGSAPFYNECGLPLMLGDDALAAELLGIGSGRVELSLHPRLGVVRLAGQFWAVANPYAVATLDQVRRQHADCIGCPGASFTQVIGVQVVTASIRLPGAAETTPLDLDEYLLARPDPVATHGATLAAHLNADHQPELATLAASLTGERPAEVLGARVGVVDTDGFELSVVTPDGGRSFTVPFASPVRSSHQLPDVMHDAIATAIQRAD